MFILSVPELGGDATAAGGRLRQRLHLHQGRSGRGLFARWACRNLRMEMRPVVTMLWRTIIAAKFAAIVAIATAKFSTIVAIATAKFSIVVVAITVVFEAIALTKFSVMMLTAAKVSAGAAIAAATEFAVVVTITVAKTLMPSKVPVIICVTAKSAVDAAMTTTAVAATIQAKREA